MGLRRQVSALHPFDSMTYACPLSPFDDMTVGMTVALPQVRGEKPGGEVLMIKLSFNTLQSVGPVQHGPAPYFRVEGSSLFEGPHNRVIARYGQRYWQFENRHLSSYECRDRTQLRFENKDGQLSEVLGPFARVLFPNGSCYADDRRLAEYVEDAEQWLRFTDYTRWSAIVITPAPFSPAV